MIVYNVTLVVQNDLQVEFLEWLKSEHIPDVLATGLFEEGRLFRIIEDPDLKGFNSIAVQYRLKSWDEFYQYREKHSQRLQQITKDRYGDKVLSFRTYLEEI
jgi:hypothetical protein